MTRTWFEPSPWFLALPAVVLCLCVLSLGFSVPTVTQSNSQPTPYSHPRTALPGHTSEWQETMFQYSASKLSSNTLKYSFHAGKNGPPLSWEEASTLLVKDHTFRNCIKDILAKAPYKAFLWETKPVTPFTASRNDFEFVLVDSPALARFSCDGSPFDEHLRPLLGTDKVKTFANLGGDAELVVPAESIQGCQSYTHLAKFMREGSDIQIHNLFSELGKNLLTRFQQGDKNPVWVSTNGLGVSYLHIRIDQYPKYYHYDSYRKAES